MHLNERIKSLRERLKINSQEELATIVGLPRHKIADLERGKTKELKAEDAAQFAENLHINGWWLLTGQGSMNDEMAQSPTSDTNALKIEPLCHQHTSAQGQTDAQTLPVLILDASLFTPQTDTAQLRYLRLQSDNMEPTLHKGDYVVIHIQQHAYVDDLYAIMIDRRLMIRRLHFRVDGTIGILSDNPKYPHEVYDPSVAKESFEIIGRRVLTLKQ